MTRTVKLEGGGTVSIADTPGGMRLRVLEADVAFTDRDLRRLLGTLARTKAARRQRGRVAEVAAALDAAF